MIWKHHTSLRFKAVLYGGYVAAVTSILWGLSQ